MFVRAIQIVLTIFCMIGIGYLLAHKGWLHAEASSLLSRMVLYVALPAMIVQNLFTQYNRQTLLSGAYGMLAPLSVLTLLYLFSGLLARILPIPQRRRGVFRSVFTFSNSIFIGLPICKAVLGDAAIPSSLFYYIVNTSFFWIIGANGIRRDGEKEAVSLSFLETIRRVFSPPLITFLLSATLVLLGVPLPEFVLSTAKYVGNMVTPLSMFFIGATLYRMHCDGFHWEKGYGWVLAGRFVLAPAILLGSSTLLGLSPLMRDAFFLQAAMPSQTQNAIVAHTSGADTAYATGAIALSTLCSLFFIPLYAIFLQMLG